ncbi:MAG: hypothetical protein EOP06_21710, partial [Proteobacteria bacterium]
MAELKKELGYKMKSMVRIVILLLLTMISTELVAPLLAEAHSVNHEIQCSLSHLENSDFKVDGSPESNCLDQCGAPTHVHMSQFPPSAFHESLGSVVVHRHGVRAFSAPTLAH